METIDRLIEGLNWNNSAIDQQHAINRLATSIKDEDIGVLIQPGNDKAYWENAALVLKQIGSPRIDSEVPRLLEWLADLNWPGALVVLELLATVDKGVLIPFLNDAQSRAIKEGDDLWLDGLGELRKRRST